MKRNFIYTLILILIILSGCRDDVGTIDNKVFIDGKSSVNKMLVKAGVSSFTRTITAAIAKPCLTDIDINYDVDIDKLAKYNRLYREEALILPEKYYDLSNNTGRIIAGNIKADDIIIEFKDLDNLNSEKIYVLPISITKASMNVLISDNTKYFVVKGASLINVVGNIDKNYLTIDWQTPDVANNLSQVTMEALVRFNTFDFYISTVMGVEGKFLIRFGGQNSPRNQAHLYANGLSFPDPDTQKGIAVNEWAHVAVTYDSATGKSILYINGNEQASQIKDFGNINLGLGGLDGFCIGYSYSDKRYLRGEISEARVWNVVRTQEEIANNPYYVSPDSKGLVAYWKFDDESALSVHDYSGNGNDAIANNKLEWTPVKLPESNE